MPWHKSDATMASDGPFASQFDPIYSPGVPAPSSGIYQCIACHYEIVRDQGHALPPASDKVHDNWGLYDSSEAQAKWLIVRPLDKKPGSHSDNAVSPQFATRVV